MLEIIKNIDYRGVDFFYQNRSEFWSDLMLRVTYLGGNIFIIFLSVVVISALIISKKKNTALVFAGALFATNTLVYILKILVLRMRPDSIISLYFENSPSFPSGHSAMSLCLYGLLAYLAVLFFKKKYQDIVFVGVASALVLVIGFSRVYLGVHYPSDVLGGYIVGLFFLIPAIRLMKNLDENKQGIS